MTELQELREMFTEVKEILIEGYRNREKDNLAKLIEQFDVDLLVSLSIPFIQAEIQKANIDNGERASL